MRLLHRKARLLFGLVALTLAMSGCTSIQLVSNYDETIDNQAQQLQKKLDTHFILLQYAAGEQLKYKSQQAFYGDVLADLDAMRVRADGIYQNKLTVEQIDLVKENVAYLVLLHKQCITAPLTDEQRKKVKDNGIDLSLDCHVDNGANADVAGRGDISINRFVLAPLQAMFNQHLGAIMALELAKKRGETSSK